MINLALSKRKSGQPLINTPHENRLAFSAPFFHHPGGVTMNHAKEFYSELHTKDQSYSAGTYHLESLLKVRALQDWLAQTHTGPLRVLDVGCGKGLFLRDFVAALRQRWKVNSIEVTGADLVCSPGNYHAEIAKDFKFVPVNLEGQPLPFPDNSFDFLCCNHVVEHIFETEQLIREFRRVLTPQGLCIISVPNAAAWVNRVFFLFAGQPLGSELGTEKVTYGFWPASLQPRLEAFKPSGHIRDFTPRGLRDLTRHCGFETVGWWKQSPGPIARLGKWAGRNLAIVLKPARG
jgi:ubiquinone/menaquinone biosynthesis C-methylase UbiE